MNDDHEEFSSRSEHLRVRPSFLSPEMMFFTRLKNGINGYIFLGKGERFKDWFPSKCLEHWSGEDDNNSKQSMKKDVGE